MVQLEGVLDAEAGLQLELVWAGQEGVRGEVGGKEASRSALGMTRPNRGHRTTPAVSRSEMKAKNPVLYFNTN